MKLNMVHFAMMLVVARADRDARLRINDRIGDDTACWGTSYAVTTSRSYGRKSEVHVSSILGIIMCGANPQLSRPTTVQVEMAFVFTITSLE